ncbi:hypothetical protein BH11ACT4_BH11ACT4_12440 [soil metagenome]
MVCDDFGMPDPSPQRSRLVVAAFVIYLVLLAWLILWKLESPYVGAAALLPRPVKFVPFVAAGDADASAPLEVVANILLFVPFGVYLGLLAPAWRWWKPALVLVGASLLLESLQHLLSIGTFDTSDVISNTAGGLAGLAIVAVARRRAVPWTRICVAFTAIAVIAAAAFVASPLRYSAPRDVIFPSPSAAPYTSPVALALDHG